MKTFRWVHLTTPDERHTFISLLDVTQEFIVRACGTLAPTSSDGELFHVLVTNPNTGERLTLQETLPLKDAKEAVQKKLFDDGVIEDGDLVEDTTE